MNSKKILLKKIILYICLPAVVSLSLVLAYFSEITWLQNLISPTIKGLSFAANREMGLLENLQNATLLAMFVIAAFGVKRKKIKLEKVFWGFVLLFSTLVFLEEIDYGWHFRELFWNQTPNGFRNIHNVGDANQIIKTFLDIFMLGLFVLMPVIFIKSKRPLFKYVTPDIFSTFTIISMIPVLSLAGRMEKAGMGLSGTLAGNVSEFRELYVYYLFMLFMFELVFKRNLVLKSSEDSADKG